MPVPIPSDVSFHWVFCTTYLHSLLAYRISFDIFSMTLTDFHRMIFFFFLSCCFLYSISVFLLFWVQCLFGVIPFESLSIGILWVFSFFFPLGLFNINTCIPQVWDIFIYDLYNSFFYLICLPLLWGFQWFLYCFSWIYPIVLWYAIHSFQTFHLLVSSNFLQWDNFRVTNNIVACTYY